MGNTQNLKVIVTDESGAEKVIFTRDYPLENFCKDYGFKVSEEQLLAWEKSQQIEIPNSIPDSFNIQSFIDSIEDKLITTALSTTNGNKLQAAKLLGMQRTTLQEKIKRRGLSLLDNNSQGLVKSEIELLTREVIKDRITVDDKLTGETRPPD